MKLVIEIEVCENTKDAGEILRKFFLDLVEGPLAHTPDEILDIIDKLRAQNCPYPYSVGELTMVKRKNDSTAEDTFARACFSEDPFDRSRHHDDINEDELISEKHPLPAAIKA